MPDRIVVLVSGSGTLLQALLDEPDAPYEVVAVVSDTHDAYGLHRADEHGIPTHVLPPRDHPDRAAWDQAFAELLQGLAPDWIVCAGFMRILGPVVLATFPHRIVNTHPALLPSFPGAHGVRDAMAYGVKVTGCTVHLVDAGVDTGPILAQQSLEVRPEDDELALHERIKIVERRLLVDVVSRISVVGCSVDGRKATIP